MIPVNTLTEAQAAEELGCLLDAKPAPEEQLEFHIAHLQATPAAAPEPPSKLALLLATYNANVAKVVAEPDRLVLRQRVSHAKHDIKAHCRRTKQPMPELAPLPPTPEEPARVLPEAVRGRASAAHQRQVAEDAEERAQTLVVMAEMGATTGLDNCHPYTCTPAEVQAAMRAPEPAQADVYAHYADVSATDLDFRDRNCGAVSPHAPTAIERADRIRRDLTVLLAELDALADRQALRPALDAIWARLQMCYQVVDEGTMSEAG